MDGFPVRLAMMTRFPSLLGRGFLLNKNPSRFVKQGHAQRGGKVA